MIILMTSKEFQEFINDENDNDILDCQYVIISQRIHKSSQLNNVVNGKNILFPDATVLSSLDDNEMKELYFSQLDENMAFLDNIIKLSIEKKYAIIFLTTKKEDKYLKLLDMIQEYIFIKYDYPTYKYSYYVNGGDLLKYNKKKVLKMCNKHIKENQLKILERLKGQPEEKVIHELKRYDKEDLIKFLKLLDKDAYKSNMSKRDIIDSLMVFL